jgi:hypothetical protein
MKAASIIVDLDGTLTDPTHRQHHLQKSPKDWDAFFEGLPDDPPNDWCVQHIRGMRMIGFQILFVTGRDGKHLEETEFWLNRHNYFLEMTDIHLFMRAAGDKRQDDIVKAEIYRNEIQPNYKVFYAIDDRKRVADMWRRIGVTCLHCAEGDF